MSKKPGQPDSAVEMTAGRRSLTNAFHLGFADDEMMRMAANWMRDLVSHRGIPLEVLEDNPLYASLMAGTCTSYEDQQRVERLIMSWVRDPNERQVGGQHYQSSIQHWDFVSTNSMSYLGSQVTKYAVRWRKKNGIQDVEKSIHFLEKMIDSAEKPMHEIGLEEFFAANPDLSPDEREVVSWIYYYEKTGVVDHLRQARIHLERLWLAANAAAR